MYYSNCWVSISASENDIRQPLFGVFSSPVAVIPYSVSLILFFIPNTYAYLTAITQVIVLIFSYLLIANLLNLNNIYKILFLSIISLTFPTLLFSLNLEQYIFSVFWLILFIYIVVEKMEYTEVAFIGCAGSMLTGGILFPLLIKEKNFKKTVAYLFKVLIAFGAFCFIFGRTYILGDIENLKLMLSFTGRGLPLLEKLQQYTAFIMSCFIAPDSEIVDSGVKVVYLATTVDKFNYCGIAVLILCLIGFFLNRKDKFAQICFGWVIFSIVLLGIVGWGASENGMVLYTLYFAWAYISLIFLLINKIPERFKFLKYIIFGIIVIALLFFNIKGLFDILSFATKYYPVRVLS